MKVENVEDIYRLSPVQQEILSRELESPSTCAYVRQYSYVIDAALHVDAFEQAWQQVLDRHPILRTSFHWESLEKPVQVVNRRVRLSPEQHDWRSLSASEQEERLHGLLRTEQERRFELTMPPLMRLQLIRVSEDAYRLVWSYHGLLMDEWSRQRVLREVSALYDSICKRQERGLEPSQPYKIYVEWLRRQNLSQAETFWREMLKGFDAPTLLSRNPSARNSQEHQEERIELSAETTAALQSQAAQRQLNIETLVEGAWALLLSRYADTDDVVFGMYVSGRHAALPESMSAVGLFGHAVPVRVHVPAESALLPWLKRLQTQRDEISLYEYTALSDIRRWSDVAHGQALFESLLVFDDAQELATSLRIRRNGWAEKFEQPLVLKASLLPQLSLRLCFERHSFHPSQVARMLAHLKILLEGIAANTEQRLSELPLLTQPEQRLLLEDWNNTQTGTSQGECLHELFESVAARTPARTALVCGEESLTFEELNRRANQLARHLRGLGVGPEVPVGICAQRSLETVIALLGILKAGGVYVPLDPEYPQERLSYMLEDTGVSVLLTQQHLIFDLPPYAAASEIVCLDSDWETISQESDENLSPFVTGANLAYIIYTSGSTGRPKGVCISHEAIASHLRIVGKKFALDENDRMLQFASLNFDVSIEQIWTPLLCGATTILRDARAWSVAEFYQEVSERGVTVINVSPSYWNLLTQESATATKFGLDKQLKLVIVGGDAMSSEATRQWRQTDMGAARLLNAYGPTETTITATVFDVPSDYDWHEASTNVPIGRPLGNRKVYILDRQGNLSPIGATGELHLGGTLLARGYLNNPEQTAEKFIPDAFSNEPGARLYRTGDLARYRDDGQIEFLGRIDHQIKIRGFRIEAGEIEAALRQNPSVREAIVVAREEAGGDKRLVAYVALKQRDVGSVDELRDALKEKLPAHMVPAAFILLEELPLTPNGKIDRRALPAPATTEIENGDAYVAPSTSLEELLVDIWRDVLNVERVSVHDNFFDLGGHSLLATQVISRLRQRLQVEVPLHSFFENPVIAELAKEVEALGLAPQPAAPPMLPVSRERDLPLSFAQQRLWFLDQLEPGSAAYNISGAIRLAGRLDTDALAQSLSEIIRRHEALRTTFDLRHGQPAQIINEAQPVSLPYVDLGQLPESEREARVRELAIEDATRPVDLKRGPLARFSLLRLSDESHVLLVTMHHIISDGWSIGVFVRELASLYAAFSESEASPLEELQLQYADYAVWQKEWLRGEMLERQLAYWSQQLEGAPPLLELPADRPRPPLQTFKGATYTLELPRSLSEAAKELSSREEVTLFMTLLATFKVLLHYHSGAKDLVVGMDVANRNRVESEGLIGFFVNQLVLRTKLEGELSFREFLRRVREVTLGAYEHQDLPFDKLVEVLRPERDLSRNPLFQVMFGLLNAPLPPLETAGLSMSLVEFDNETSVFDLSLYLTDTERGMTGALRYNTDLFDSSTVARLARHFEMLVGKVTSDPAAAINELVGALAEADREERSSRQDEFKATRQRMLKSMSLKPLTVTNLHKKDVEAEL
jgi:amino acid adenylation domain-containing protein